MWDPTYELHRDDEPDGAADWGDEIPFDGEPAPTMPDLEATHAEVARLRAELATIKRYAAEQGYALALAAIG